MKYRKSIALILAVLLLGAQHSCDPVDVEAGFEDLIGTSIYDYLVENDSLYSSFLSILKAGGIDLTLSAYNPDGLDYTLFLPDNAAVDEYIAMDPQFASLTELLQDADFTATFSRYHVLNLGIKSDDFPFGALPERTLSGDILTVAFIIEPDTSYYKINNQAPISLANLEMSNGWIHAISSSLIPVTKTSWEWLEENEDYSIFRDAAQATGLWEKLDINNKDLEEKEEITLLLEADSVYEKQGIGSFEELAELISPGDDQYSSPDNPLHGFVGYHMMEESRFLDDFSENSSNYTTYSPVPVHIDGFGLDIEINPGLQVFDTIIVEGDTTIIDFVGIYYDHSNVLSQTGSIHLIDRVLTQQTPNPAFQTYEWWDEPLLNEYRQTPGEYLIEDTTLLNNFTWWGTELYFIETGDPDHSAWGGDFLFMNGDFVIQRHIPKIVQGIYDVEIRAERGFTDNALIEVYIDGKNIGGLVDLSQRPSGNAPFQMIDLGTINFVKYETHEVEIRSLIPGSFSWDLIRFTPFENE